MIYIVMQQNHIHRTLNLQVAFKEPDRAAAYATTENKKARDQDQELFYFVENVPKG